MPLATFAVVALPIVVAPFFSVKVTVPVLTVDADVTVADKSIDESPYVADALDAFVVVDAFATTLIETVAGVESCSPSFVLNVKESLPVKPAFGV